MRTIEDVYRDAWEAFSEWCRKHDPDGEMSALEQTEAYGKWCDGERSNKAPHLG